MRSCGGGGGEGPGDATLTRATSSHAEATQVAHAAEGSSSGDGTFGARAAAALRDVNRPDADSSTQSRQLPVSSCAPAETVLSSPAVCGRDCDDDASSVQHDAPRHSIATCPSGSAHTTNETPSVATSVYISTRTDAVNRRIRSPRSFRGDIRAGA